MNATAPPQDQSSSSVLRRISLMEDRIDSLREHINLIENNFIDKNKTIGKEMQEINEKMREIKVNLISFEENMTQMIEKSNDFATKDQLKVLERYLYFLNPLDYITRKELKNLIPSLEEKDVV